jgi:hypothetical protein
MKTTTRMSQVGDFALERRSFLRMIAAGAAVVGVPSLLTGCATATPTTGAAAGGAAGGAVDALIPKYIPVNYVTPDFPGVKGSIPGFLTLPKKLVQSVTKVPGSGSTFKAMVPLWGTIPTMDGNQYYQAVNDMLGSKVEFQVTDGNTYGDKLATVLASQKDVPDWVSVPAWTLPPRFGAEIVGNVFEDLTPFLAGDKIKDYPNLANIPSDAWKFCVFNGKLAPDRPGQARGRHRPVGRCLARRGRGRSVAVHRRRGDLHAGHVRGVRGRQRGVRQGGAWCAVHGRLPERRRRRATGRVPFRRCCRHLGAGERRQAPVGVDRVVPRSRPARLRARVRVHERPGHPGRRAGAALNRGRCRPQTGD